MFDIQTISFIIDNDYRFQLMSQCEKNFCLLCFEFLELMEGGSAIIVAKVFKCRAHEYPLHKEDSTKKGRCTLEISQLKAFNVVETLNPDQPAFSARELFEDNHASDIISNAVKILDTNRPQAAGSLLGNRLNILAAIQCYCMIHYGCALDLSKSKMYLQWDNKKLLFYFDKPQFTYAGRKNRSGWREDVFRQLIKDTLLPVYQKIYEETKCPLLTIWSNLSHSLQNRYEKWMAEMKDEKRRKQAEEDFSCLIKEADPQWFAKSKNPLNRNFTPIEHASEEGQFILQRQNCCMAYCLNSKADLAREDRYCYTCPNLGEEERAKRRLRIQEKKSS